MSFKDEISSKIKSPQDAKREYEEGCKKRGQEMAEEDFEELKKKLLFEAEINNYKIVNGKKVLEATQRTYNVELLLSFERIAGRQVGAIYWTKTIRYYTDHNVTYRSYMDRIMQLAKDDEIAIKLRMPHYQEGNDSYVYLPRILDSKGEVADVWLDLPQMSVEIIGRVEI